MSLEASRSSQHLIVLGFMDYSASSQKQAVQLLAKDLVKTEKLTTDPLRR